MKLCETSALEQRALRDLVDEARDGDRDSMGRLAVLVQERLYPYLYQATLSHNLSQDLVQETLLAMTRSLGSLERARRFWPWIHRIARSKLQDNFRRQRSRASAISIWHERRRSWQPQNNDILNVLVHEEKLEYAAAALRRLRKHYRDVIRLRCFEQMSYPEIASTLRCSRLQARVTFTRAKRALRNDLPAMYWQQDK